MKYEHRKIESKWQKVWEKKKVYQALNNSKKKKYYVLDMFPYPSGAGLHVGHPKGYIGSDVFARLKRMQGYNVLHPMGYDAFGLPAEQYAIEHNINPAQAVKKNIETFERQLSIIGLSYDWKRRVNTTDPKYYKWTQWIFLKIYNSWYNPEKNKAEPIETLIKKFKKEDKTWNKKSEKEREDILMKYRLAYEGMSEVNWCPKLGTVLANDEIIDGENGLVSERGGYPVEKKLMRQWFMRITAYAERLLSGLDTLYWSTHIKEIQKNWIGRSEGAEIEFVVRQGLTIKVFTTRPDTIFGVTFLAVSPEVAKKITGKDFGIKTDLEKEEKNKIGIDTGIKAKNPASGEVVPVYVVNYVSANYGTGAIMGVPAHDERDFEFAKKYNLPIKQVVMPDITDPQNPPRKGKKDTERDVVSIILFDQNEKKVLLQFLKGEKWEGLDPKTFLTGGIEENETPLVAATREIKEETGYVNFKFIEQIPFDVQAKFFAAHKDVNRVVHSRTLVFKLINEEKTEITEDEYFTKNSHDMVWIQKEKVFKTITVEDRKEVWRFYESGGFAYGGDGILINSGKFSGMDSEKAKKEIVKFVGGKIVTNYKMRDAIFARQRYWGEPIPLIHKKDGTIEELPEKKLPLKLPPVKSYKPTGTGESPLALVKDWVKKGYETNTMPGWAGSSWYFLRYMDPKNKKAFADKAAIKYWKNVDMYVGGAEHATGHLLYARFWHKFLKDYGLVVTEEPFQTLRNQGMILGADNRKMSKRWGNVINPDEVVKNFGADTLRMYEMFMGPFESSLPWSTDNIIGVRRFLERVWKIASQAQQNFHSCGTHSVPREGRNDENFAAPVSLTVLLHKTIKKVGEDIESFSFNTAVSSMMIFLNEFEFQMSKMPFDSREIFETFLKILSPFAPHITEELWQMFGHKNLLVNEPWPKYDPKKLEESEVKIVVQINGKVRAEIFVKKDESEEKIKERALKNESISKYLTEKNVRKVIYVKNRLLSIVVG